MTYGQAVTCLTTREGACTPSDEALEMILDPDCRNVGYLSLTTRTLAAWPVLEEEPPDGGEIYEEPKTAPMFEVIGEAIYDASDDGLSF